MKQPSFTARLFDCDDGSSLRTSGGSRFIRKLPDKRSLGYLHKFYAPLAAETDAELLRRLPDAYVSFLRWANGAALYDNTVNLYGYVDLVSRSSAPEAAAAISIINDNEVFFVVNRERWDQGWTRIGTLSGWDSTFTIQANRDGRCAIVTGRAAVTASSFAQCMTKIVERLTPCFNCKGIVDQSYAELEAALDSLIHPH